MLDGMARSWLQRMLAPLLAVLFAVSMSVSAVQAAEVTVKMATGYAVSTVQHNKCPDCDHGSKGMKGGNCGLAVCSQSVVSLPQTSTLPASTNVVDVPSPLQPTLVGRAHAPDPYPPRPSSFA